MALSLDLGRGVKGCWGLYIGPRQAGNGALLRASWCVLTVCGDGEIRQMLKTVLR